jgi:cystathionine gamma-synthase
MHYLIPCRSLVLNPQGRYYKTLKDHLDSTFEDIYFDEDAIYLERNSRDFKRRIWRINTNTEAVCDFLCSRSIAGGDTSPDAVIKQVFYPKYSTPENYERCRKKKGEDEEGGYGGLFSLTFTSRAASEAFFDALQCFKGPSLGTNFTLACPYTILAHYGELDWAAGFGVEVGLVRVSVGMEDKEDLLKLFEVALNAAQIQAQVASQ